MQTPIRPCNDADFEFIWQIINDGALAYRGHVPADCLHAPYMSRAELRAELADGVEFHCFERDNAPRGVMGLQRVRDVFLIRHAYVRTADQGTGIGSRLLKHLVSIADTPILIGTWADATPAIRFYLSHGFRQVSADRKERLLKKYWKVSERQIEASVVLADPRWHNGERLNKPCL
jgi:GNAT superfamily N-acetyltransferase